MTTTSLYKSIVYAYPSSLNASLLGMVYTGCWYVQQRNIDGFTIPYLAHNCKGFVTPNNPYLIALYHRYEGNIDPWFVKHGNPDALKAINR